MLLGVEVALNNRPLDYTVIPVLQRFQLNFGAGNFRGRRPSTSALRMLLRLTAVKYAGLVGSGFLCKVSQDMTTGDKGKPFFSFCSFIYSLPTQQDCVLPVVLYSMPESVTRNRFVPFSGIECRKPSTEPSCSKTSIVLRGGSRSFLRRGCTSKE